MLLRWFFVSFFHKRPIVFSHFLFCLELVSGLEKKAFSQENNIFHKVIINRFVKNGSEMRIGNKPSKNTLTFAGGEGEIKNEFVFLGKTLEYKLKEVVSFVSCGSMPQVRKL